MPKQTQLVEKTTSSETNALVFYCSKSILSVLCFSVLLSIFPARSRRCPVSQLPQLALRWSSATGIIDIPLWGAGHVEDTWSGEETSGKKTPGLITHQWVKSNSKLFKCPRTELVRPSLCWRWRVGTWKGFSAAQSHLCRYPDFFHPFNFKYLPVGIHKLHVVHPVSYSRRFRPAENWRVGASVLGKTDPKPFFNWSKSFSFHTHDCIALSSLSGFLFLTLSSLITMAMSGKCAWITY